MRKLIIKNLYTSLYLLYLLLVILVVFNIILVYAFISNIKNEHFENDDNDNDNDFNALKINNLYINKYLDFLSEFKLNKSKKIFSKTTQDCHKISTEICENVDPSIYMITTKYCPYQGQGITVPTNTNLKCYNKVYNCCKSNFKE